MSAAQRSAAGKLVRDTAVLDRLDAAYKHIVAVSASVFTRICENADSKKCSQPDTSSMRENPFLGVSPPDITCFDYLSRLATWLNCKPASFIVANIYLDRFLSLHPTLMSSFSIHRLVLTAIACAIKMWQDSYFSNKYMAKVSLFKGKQNVEQ